MFYSITMQLWAVVKVTAARCQNEFLNQHQK